MTMWPFSYIHWAVLNDIVLDDYIHGGDDRGVLALNLSVVLFGGKATISMHTSAEVSAGAFLVGHFGVARELHAFCQQLVEHVAGIPDMNIVHALVFMASGFTYFHPPEESRIRALELLQLAESTCANLGQTESEVPCVFSSLIYPL